MKFACRNKAVIYINLKADTWGILALKTENIKSNLKKSRAELKPLKHSGDEYILPIIACLRKMNVIIIFIIIIIIIFLPQLYLKSILPLPGSLFRIFEFL